MKLKRLDFRDIYGSRSSDLLLTRENILERLMLLITSYFCMGTELRFLKQMQIEGFENTIDPEYWHGKALEISVKFLPGDCPLTKHIVSSYAKHHSPSYEKIPEDLEVDSDVRVIKPFKGLVSNKLSPLIKSIDSPSVRLSPLDLDPNDYAPPKLFKSESHLTNTKSQKLSKPNFSKSKITTNEENTGNTKSQGSKPPSRNNTIDHPISIKNVSK